MWTRYTASGTARGGRALAASDSLRRTLVTFHASDSPVRESSFDRNAFHRPLI
jgi:hypothetical protein